MSTKERDCVMDVGISTACFYPMETEQALQKEIDLGFRTFEIFFNSSSELKKPFLADLKERIGQEGRIVSIHPFTSGYESYLLFSQYTRRFEDSLDFYENYFEAANVLGADILVIHGEKNILSFSDEQYLDRFYRLSERGRKFGVRVAQENVVSHRGQHPSFIRKMREQLGEYAYFVLDIKQAIRAKVCPHEMCDAMGDRLIHLHANDHNASFDCLLAGEGGMDFARLFGQMKKNGFTGDCILEVYNSAIDGDEALRRSKTVLEGMIHNS